MTDFAARALRLVGLEKLCCVPNPADVKGPGFLHFDEYHTARLALAVWDALERGELAA